MGAKKRVTFKISDNATVRRDSLQSQSALGIENQIVKNLASRFVPTNSINPNSPLKLHIYNCNSHSSSKQVDQTPPQQVFKKLMLPHLYGNSTSPIEESIHEPSRNDSSPSNHSLRHDMHKIGMTP